MRIELEPSIIAFSPYHYLYFYLTDKGTDGPHIIVSDAGEFDSNYKGLFVGRYDNADDDKTAALCLTFQDAMQLVQELIGEYEHNQRIEGTRGPAGQDRAEGN